SSLFNPQLPPPPHILTTTTTPLFLKDKRRTKSDHQIIVPSPTVMFIRRVQRQSGMRISSPQAVAHGDGGDLLDLHSNNGGRSSSDEEDENNALLSKDDATTHDQDYRHQQKQFLSSGAVMNKPLHTSTNTFTSNTGNINIPKSHNSNNPHNHQHHQDNNEDGAGSFGGFFSRTFARFRSSLTDNFESWAQRVYDDDNVDYNHRHSMVAVTTTKTNKHSNNDDINSSSNSSSNEDIDDRGLRKYKTISTTTTSSSSNTNHKIQRNGDGPMKTSSSSSSSGNYIGRDGRLIMTSYHPDTQTYQQNTTGNVGGGGGYFSKRHNTQPNTYTPGYHNTTAYAATTGIKGRGSLGNLSFEIKLEGRNKGIPKVMTKTLARELQGYIPRRIQISRKWKLLYSMEQHGTSIRTLYNQVDKKGPVLLAIKDTDGHVFGAFLSDPPKADPSFYGNGTSFLWRSYRSTSIPSSSGYDSVQVYKSTGDNQYYIHCQPEFIAVGGGRGKFGLWFDSEFTHGYSSKCPTFNNQILCNDNLPTTTTTMVSSSSAGAGDNDEKGDGKSSSQFITGNANTNEVDEAGKDFKVMNVELWGFDRN
ncbi:oxidation resistance protein 1, partial [Mycoemilia scoparia]